MRPAFGWSCLAVLLASSLVQAAPRGTVIVKRTRQEFNDVEWEVEGDRVEVKLPYGSRFFRLDDLLLVPMAGSEGQSGSAATDDEDSDHGPTAVAWHARCRLTPDDGWEPIAPSTPDRLIELKHASGARLALSLVPVEADFDLTGRNGVAQLKDWIQRDLRAAYTGVRLNNPAVEQLFGADVVGVGPILVSPVGRSEKLNLQQIRFRRYGFEYVLSLLTANDDQGKQLQEQALQLFHGFSFLPAVSRTATRYSDFGRGFSIRIPGPDWEMVDRPFSSTEPVSMKSGNGQAELTVTLSDGDNAAAFVRDMLGKRKSKSKYYSAERVQTTHLDGAEVERFQFEDFQAGGRKKLRFHGFSIALAGKVVTFLGVSPLTHEEARKLEEEIDGSLTSTRIYDKGSMADRLGRLRDAGAKLSAGYEALQKKDYADARANFDDAISLNDQSALAYFLRGQARRGLDDFDGFKADLDRAIELDPNGGYGATLAPSYAAEADAAMKEKNYARALENWDQALRIDATNEQYLTGLGKCVKDWWGEENRARELDTHRTLSDIERAVKRYDDQPAIVEALAYVFKQGATRLQRDKDWAKAKRWAKKLRGLDGHRDEGDKLYDTIKTAEDREKGR